jgi:hypothetical protein
VYTLNHPPFVLLEIPTAPNCDDDDDVKPLQLLVTVPDVVHPVHISLSVITPALTRLVCTWFVISSCHVVDISVPVDE